MPSSLNDKQHKTTPMYCLKPTLFQKKNESNRSSCNKLTSNELTNQCNCSFSVYFHTVTGKKTWLANSF